MSGVGIIYVDIRHRWAWMDSLHWWLLEKFTSAHLSAGPPPYTASQLLAAVQKEKLAARPPQIDWGVVAVVTFQKWLHRQEQLQKDAPDLVELLSHMSPTDTAVQAALMEAVVPIFKAYRATLKESPK